MVSSPVKLTISRPCTQPWQAMAPDQQGRFCAHCQKTVVDFTGMTNAQVLAHLRATAGAPGCGRLRADQLNRVLSEPQHSRAGRWSWIGMLLSGWLSSQVVQAQSKEPKEIATVVTFTPEQAATSHDVSVGRPTSLILEGRIVEAGTGRPVVGANVLISNSTYDVNADTTGHFRLVVPQLPTDTTVRLIARAIGYLPQTMTVSPDMAGQPLGFTLSEATASLNEVVYTGGYIAEKPTLWQRIRNLLRH